MSYRLPNISIEHYRLLDADEQYLLISSIHALYEKMALGKPTPITNLPTLNLPSQADALKRYGFRTGSASCFIVEVMLAAGSGAALQPKEILQRVSEKTQKITKTTLWTTLHRLVDRGILESTDASVKFTKLARYRLKT